MAAMLKAEGSHLFLLSLDFLRIARFFTAFDLLILPQIFLLSTPFIPLCPFSLPLDLYRKVGSLHLIKNRALDSLDKAALT
jgi:hypothetical protein